MSSRDDILAAATEAFAEKGFDAVSVREICTAAGTNSAAVNYHFGSKSGLYRDVIRHAYESTRSTSMPVPDPAGDPEEALGEWIRWYVGPVDQDASDPARRLLLREAAQPTEELDDVVRSTLHPVYEGLERIVAELLPRDVGARERKLQCLSILGQCLVHRVCREMIDRLPVEPPLGPKDNPAIAEIVTRNALASLQASRAASNTEAIR